jgi:hypothetical protein
MRETKEKQNLGAWLKNMDQKRFCSPDLLNAYVHATLEKAI